MWKRKLNTKTLRPKTKTKTKTITITTTHTYTHAFTESHEEFKVYFYHLVHRSRKQHRNDRLIALTVILDNMHIIIVLLVR